jgi:hypothetical protein
MGLFNASNIVPFTFALQDLMRRNGNHQSRETGFFNKNTFLNGLIPRVRHSSLGAGNYLAAIFSSVPLKRRRLPEIHCRPEASGRDRRVVMGASADLYNLCFHRTMSQKLMPVWLAMVF